MHSPCVHVELQISSLLICCSPSSSSSVQEEAEATQEAAADTSAVVSELDETMKEIQASLDEFTGQPTAEGSDDESDSEDEEEGGWSLYCPMLLLLCSYFARDF